MFCFFYIKFSFSPRFAPFQNSLHDISFLFESWDRTTGNISAPDSVKAETDVEIPVAQSISVAKKTDKKSKYPDKEKLKEVLYKMILYLNYLIQLIILHQ